MQDKTFSFNATQELKNLSNTLFNQTKYNTDLIKEGVQSFQKEIIRKNPVNSMQYNWQIAQMRKTFVFWATLPFVISESFWSTWADVYSPKGKE